LEVVVVVHGRELGAAFVEMADTLGGDFDIGDYLRRLSVRCVESTAVDAVGSLVVDRRGRGGVVAASSVAAERLEEFEMAYGDGPGRDCFRTGRAVGPVALVSGVRWPRFAEMARAAGFGSVEARPMRLRESTIGAVSLFVRARGVAGSAGGAGVVGARGADADDSAVVQALADVATVGLLRRRRVHDQEELAAQLRRGLESRIVIEQAKGVLAEREGLSADAAFAGMRAYARNRNLRLRDVAVAVVSGGDVGRLGGA
jgi:hypothetical protein